MKKISSHVSHATVGNQVVYKGNVFDVTRDRMNGMIDISRIAQVIKDEELPWGEAYSYDDHECIYKDELEGVIL